MGDEQTNPPANLAECCRLCLTENSDTLKSIFEDETKGREISKNIKTFVDVQISRVDRLTTLICDTCTDQLTNWLSFKTTCRENQFTLAGRLNSWSSDHNLANESVQIKEEVLDDSADPIVVDEQDDEVIHVKQENAVHIQTTDSPSKSTSDAYDQPPRLTPQLPDEDQDERISLDGIAPINEDDDDVVCQFIRNEDEVISIPDNESDEANYKDEDIQFVGNGDNADDENELDDDNMDLLVPRIEFSEGDPLPNGSNQESLDSYASSEIDKMQFYAGLRLQHSSANSSNLSMLDNINLTKVEEAYINKYRTIAQMADTLVCTCHGEKFEEYRDLFLHLQEQRSWFSINSCYNCLVSFGDRTGYMKHFCECPKMNLENLKKFIEKPMNLEVKLRLYHSYKCIKCNCIFGFHEDFCSHLDAKHMDLLGDNVLPYKCLCETTFEEEEEFKQHLSISCFLRQFCDICFDEFSTMEDFKNHCEDVHDEADADIITLFDTYRKCKFSQDDNLLVRRSKRSLPSDSTTSDSEAKKLKTDDMELLKAFEIKHEMSFDQEYLESIKANKPCDCPVCGKPYSSFHNMVRHYKTSHDPTGMILSCKFCSERFRLATELREHSLSIHPEESSQLPNFSSMLLPIPIPKNTDLKQHHLNQFSCPDCGELFKTLHDWTIHVETHPKKRCIECDAVFSLQSDLEQHRHIHWKGQNDFKNEANKPNVASSVNLTCTTCKKSFNTRPELRQHKLLHEKMPSLVRHDQEGESREDRKLGARSFTCYQCNQEFESYSRIWEHNKQFHDGRSVDNEGFPRTCDLCGKVVHSRGAWSNHQKMHDREAVGPQPIYRSPSPPASVRRASHPPSSIDAESYYTCNKCFKVFSNKYGLRNHMRSHGIYIKETVTANRSSTKTNKTYWCDICHHACVGYQELQDHRKEHTAKKLNRQSTPAIMEDRKPSMDHVCKICSLPFDTALGLIHHEQKHHPKDQRAVSFYCKSCKIPFSSINDFDEHMESEHRNSIMVTKPTNQTEKAAKGKGDIYPCQYCKKVFDNPGSLSTHQGWHKRGSFGKKILSPNKPRRKAQSEITLPSASVSRFSNHVNEIPANYACNICPKKFINETALQIHKLEVHRNINTTMVSLFCKSCQINFNSKTAFDNHMQLHEVVASQMQQKPSKAYPCKYCPAGFSRSDTLNTHVRLQHREFYNEKFHCNQCDRTFDKQNALTIHIKSHNRQRQAEELAFITQSQHNRDVFTCSICDASFVSPKELRHHTFTVHPFK